MDRNAQFLDFCDDEHTVALRKESVDRNIPSIGTFRSTHNVALRKESVDRNGLVLILPAVMVVALRKESVDRNADRHRQLHQGNQSLSARRAWIEM